MNKGTFNRAVGLRSARPRARGNALDLPQDPSFPKPRGQIEIVETGAGLTLADRKLYNVLLALSWERLDDPVAEHEPFRARTADLRRAIGEVGEHDNARLRQSFDRLMRTIIKFDYLSSDGALKEGGAPLLSFRAIPRGEGVAEWDFSTQLRPMLAEPGSWARIHLAVCARFSSKYALLLYELLSLRANLRTPVWEVGIDDLRALLQVGEKFPNYAHLVRRVLAPAVREVDELSGLTVTYTEKRSVGRGRRVEALRFTIGKKAGADLMDTARAVETIRDPVGRRAVTQRDADTADMEDGRTDRERGSPIPDAARALAARVSAGTIDELRRRFPDWDTEQALRDWSTWAAGQSEPCRNPNVAFRGFVERQASENAPEMREVAGRVDGAGEGLSSAGRRALAWLSAQGYPARKRWLDRAVARGHVAGKAAAAPNNLAVWIELVAGEIIGAEFGG